MAPSVRLNRKHAVVLDGWLVDTAAGLDPAVRSAVEHLHMALAPKHKPSRKRFPATEAYGSQKVFARAPRQGIRTAVFLRATEDEVARCEGPAIRTVKPSEAGRCPQAATELAHAFGKGKGRRPESERNCMALCHDCAVAETNNRPSSRWWWEYRADRFAWWGFLEEAREAKRRAAFVETRSNLPASPRTR